MDFSSVFNVASLLGVGAAAVYSTQLLFSDARRKRQCAVGSGFLASASYAAMGSLSGTFTYCTAALRSLGISQDWGKKHRYGIAATAIGAQTLFTIANYQSPTDFLMISSTIIGSTADTQLQSRSRDLLFIINTALINLPYACTQNNYGTMIFSSIALLILGSSFYRNSVKNAAGPNASLLQNFRTAIYALRHDLPTGANMAAQTDIHTEKERMPENIQRAYRQKLIDARNHGGYGPKDYQALITFTFPKPS